MSTSDSLNIDEHSDGKTVRHARDMYSAEQPALSYLCLLLL